MKKTVLTIVFILITGISFAQPPGGMQMPPGGMPSGGMKPDFKNKMTASQLLVKMKKELNLNELQELQVREILVESEKNRPQFNPSSGERPNFQEIKEKMENEKKKVNEKLVKVLTPEQYKKWIDEGETWKPED